MDGTERMARAGATPTPTHVAGRLRCMAAATAFLALAACSTTSTVRQPLSGQPLATHAYAASFDDRAGSDPEGIGKLQRVVLVRLNAAGLLANGASPEGRIEITVTHFYVRSDTARFLAGIMAGRDRIASEVRVFDGNGAQVGRFEVETTNLSAWGTAEGLMEQHADEIVARLQGRG
jgi:hypothetical protein